MHTEPQRRGVSGNLNSEIDRYRRAIDRLTDEELRATARREAIAARKSAAMIDERLPPSFTIPPADTKIGGILRDIAEQYGFKVTALLGWRRPKALARARQELYWRAYDETGFSMPQIGRALNRDHTTILYGIRQHEKRMLGLIS